MKSIVCLGEVLIDFVALESGVTLKQTAAFQKAAGGAPANVAVGVAKLGHSVGFISKVGQDSFGEFLVDTLRENHVDVSGISFAQDARTMLAFVSLTREGERDFMFYRHPSADMLLTPDEIPVDMMRDAAIFHYGSISLIAEPCRSATLHALKLARQANALISYDPNLRLGLWPNAEMARREILNGIPHANILKINEDELEFLLDTSDYVYGARTLAEYGPTLVLITLGKQGCYFYTSHHEGIVSGFSVDVVDTTGAGDGFVAGLLVGVLESLSEHRDLNLLTQEALIRIVRFANAVGGMTATQRGAIPSLPMRQAVEQFMIVNKLS